MEPREGLNYSTTYVKQTPEQRKQLVNHCRYVLEQIADAVEGNDELMNWVTWPMNGFPRKGLPNRSISDIIADMIQESQGRRSNGQPKDFALAPIERWNKVFKDTPYEIILEPELDTI
jgi:hypothetical protein